MDGFQLASEKKWVFDILVGRFLDVLLMSLWPVRHFLTSAQSWQHLEGGSTRLKWSFCDLFGDCRSLCECWPNSSGIPWPVPAILSGNLKLHFMWISFISVSSWLQERNLLNAVPEERQQVKWRSPCISENPYCSNASNTLPLCQTPVKLQMQINKHFNLMSSLLTFCNPQGSHGHRVLSSSRFSHYTGYAQCIFPHAKHYSVKHLTDIWSEKKANLDLLWTHGHWVCLEMMECRGGRSSRQRGLASTEWKKFLWKSKGKWKNSELGHDKMLF